MQRSHEQQRRGAGIGGADAARFDGAAEVVRHQHQAAARRAVGIVAVEGDDELRRARLHVDGHGGADDALGEGDELFGQRTQHQARVLLRRVDAGQRDDERRRRGEAGGHGGGKEGLLRGEVPQDGGGGDAQGLGDVGQRGAVEALLGEDAAGGFEDVVAGDAWRAAH